MSGACRQKQREKGTVDDMDEGRRKVWICLLIIVLAAAVIGILYYLSTAEQQGSEGFLIMVPGVETYVG